MGWGVQLQKCPQNSIAADVNKSSSNQTTPWMSDFQPSTSSLTHFQSPSSYPSTYDKNKGLSACRYQQEKNEFSSHYSESPSTRIVSNPFQDLQSSHQQHHYTPHFSQGELIYIVNSYILGQVFIIIFILLDCFAIFPKNYHV